LEKLGDTGKKPRVTVEIDEKMDGPQRRYPTLIDIQYCED
jgi:hypothetical protein